MKENELKTKPVKPKDWVTFHCRQCGECCRHLTNKLMVESLDAYRIARYLRENGQPELEFADIYAEYAEIIPISYGYPVYTMKTVGPDEACVFLKDGRCSIYPVRPRACRLYPFTVGPGSRGSDFKWYLCLDDAGHLSGGRVLVKDWAYQTFTREDREFVKREYDSYSALAAILKKLDPDAYARAMMLILHYRYGSIDLDEPFLAQYDRNLKELLDQLRELPEKKE